MPVFPQVYYLADLPTHWIIGTGPGTYWLIGANQPWATRRAYRGPVTALWQPSRALAGLVLAKLAIPAAECWPADSGA